MLKLQNTLNNLKSLDPLPLSNSNQFGDLLIYFNKHYKHFERFKVRLLRSRNQKVGTVGNPVAALEFYEDMSSLGVIPPCSPDNIYLSNNNGADSKLPKGIVVVYFPEDNCESLYVGMIINQKYVLNQRRQAFPTI